jgi:hypothetical protein
MFSRLNRQDAKPQINHALTVQEILDEHIAKQLV